MGRKKKGRRSSIKKRRDRQLYYGMAILAAAFVVVGLTTAIKGENNRTLEAGKSAEVIKKDGDVKEKAADNKEEQDVKKEDNPDIRVLIMTNGFKHIAHSEIRLSASSGLTVTYGENGRERKEYKRNKTLTITPDHEWLRKGCVRIRAVKGKVKIKSLKRGDGVPEYAGTIELRGTAEGIVIINELPVESYLCGVVPSEMPSSYELEALKAQAVCARSYAYRQMEKYSYPEYEAHVNDSTDYQVYNNSAQSDTASQAVKETAGEAVMYNGKVATTYYYSTSCGKTTTTEAWGTKPGKDNGYLKSVEIKGDQGYYEKDLPWYRWSVTVSVETLSDLIGLNTGKDIGRLKKIKITKRGPGDVALVMKAYGDKGNITVKTENKIRSALGGSAYTIKKQDGSETEGRDLLPSAFFTIKKEKDHFIIEGGGFGHGIGMSQTGANEMAKQGKDYKEILKMFYNDITVE